MLNAIASKKHPVPEHLADICRQFAQRRANGPVRHRDVAAALDIAEGELIAAHVGAPPALGLTARRLVAEWPAIIGALETVGEVMALTRNESCVHEKPGVYREASGSAMMGMVLGGDIDLRCFYSRWAHGFAVDEPTAKGPQRSLQFFDAAGTAIHKIFCRPGTDLHAWNQVIERFMADEQGAGLEARPIAASEAERPDAQIDVASLREHWSAMRDTHEFFALLKKHGVTRTQALRLADPRFVQALEPDCVHDLLIAASRDAVPIMVFVGNPGMIQIHSGLVHRVAPMGPWLNVLDPGFNLHLRQDHVTQAWIVTKPTADGLVTSVELFDAEGNTIAMFFGERKPGRPELCSWRDLVAGLGQEAAA